MKEVHGIRLKGPELKRGTQKNYEFSTSASLESNKVQIIKRV